MRARGIAEIERRAQAYGLPPLAWPDPYPANTLTAMRAATWAQQAGEARAFAFAAFALAFVEGLDLTDRAVVLRAADNAGLDSGGLDRALDDPDIKQALRDANDAAIAAHVYGVPTFDAGGMLWWGDEQLEAARVARQ
jgi:2-hydroxychromene-2-carboxylate isomerase